MEIEYGKMTDTVFKQLLNVGWMSATYMSRGVNNVERVTFFRKVESS